jgi:hypothetical protein
MLSVRKSLFKILKSKVIEMTNKKLHLILFIAVFIAFLFSCRSAKITDNKKDNQIIQKENVSESKLVKENGDSISNEINTKKTIQSKNDSYLDSLRVGYEIVYEGYHYSYKMLDSVPSYIKTVFPDVFFFYSEKVDMHPYSLIGAYLDGNIYSPVESFNKLYKLLHPTSDSPFEARVGALIQFTEPYGNQIEVINITQKKIQLNYTFIYSNDLNYEIKARINSEDVMYYLFFENNQFRCIGKSENNTLMKVSLIDRYN